MSSGTSSSRASAAACIGPAPPNATNAKSRGGKSQYRGVYQQKNGRWSAQLASMGRRISAGTYDTEEEAAKAYDDAAKSLHGEYARLNLTPVSNSGRHGYCGLASKGT